ncbi:hypothetical protein Tco_0787960 [Tanacetum coccineum]
MFFYLITLNLARYLNETAPQVKPPKEGKLSNAQAVQAVEAWKHSDFLCHNYVLNDALKHIRNLMLPDYALNGQNDIKLRPVEGYLTLRNAVDIATSVIMSCKVIRFDYLFKSAEKWRI